MKITKQIAQNIADNLLELKEKELRDKIVKSKEKVREEYLNLIPKEVLNIFKKFPNYINVVTSIGHAVVGEYSEYFDKSIPYPGTDVEKNNLLLKTCILDLKKLYEERRKLKELKEKTIESIYALRTSKNIELMFPEAVQYLPKAGITNQIAINFKDLFNEIKDFPKEIKKETKEEKIAKVKTANELEINKRKNETTG